MSKQSVPMRWYRFRSDAEHAREILEASGVFSVIRESDAQRRTELHSLPAAGGFDLWVDVSREEYARVKEILRDGDAPGLLCEQCQDKPATVHQTDWQNGKQVTRHLCAECGHG